MKFLKSHLSLIIALLAILFSIEVYKVFNKIVDTYEDKIVNEYSVVVVSDKTISKLQNPYIATISEINVTNSVKSMQSQGLGIDTKTILHSLPHFYKLKFSKLLTPAQLEDLEKELKGYSFIKRVESFKANQNRIYNLLLMLNNVSKIFMIIILFIAFLLIIKQMQVWKLEHSETMYIMELFGAPFWLRSVKLLKLAVIDSILAVVIIYFILIYILNSPLYLSILSQLGIKIDINILSDILQMLGISFGIAIISTLIVINSKRDDV